MTLKYRRLDKVTVGMVYGRKKRAQYPGNKYLEIEAMRRN